MNLPNKLTILRVILVPVLVVINYIPGLKDSFIFSMTSANFWMLLVFIFASFTDFLDGYIARSRNLITTFGKFMDPLADKMLVTSALVVLVEQGVVPAWSLALILTREFMVSGIRLVAVSDGKVIAASYLGKAKTATTMISIIFLFIGNRFMIFALIIYYLAVVLTAVSGFDYLHKNINIITKSK